MQSMGLKRVGCDLATEQQYMTLRILKLILKTICVLGKFSLPVGVHVTQHYTGDYLDAMVASKNNKGNYLSLN